MKLVPHGSLAASASSRTNGMRRPDSDNSLAAMTVRQANTPWGAAAPGASRVAAGPGRHQASVSDAAALSVVCVGNALDAPPPPAVLDEAYVLAHGIATLFEQMGVHPRMQPLAQRIRLADAAHAMGCRWKRLQNLLNLGRVRAPGDCLYGDASELHAARIAFNHLLGVEKSRRMARLPVLEQHLGYASGTLLPLVRRCMPARQVRSLMGVPRDTTAVLRAKWNADLAASVGWWPPHTFQSPAATVASARHQQQQAASRRRIPAAVGVESSRATSMPRASLDALRAMCAALRGP